MGVKDPWVHVQSQVWRESHNWVVHSLQIDDQETYISKNLWMTKYMLAAFPIPRHRRRTWPLSSGCSWWLQSENFCQYSGSGSESVPSTSIILAFKASNNHFCHRDICYHILSIPGERRRLPWCRSCWWIRIQTWRWTISPCRSPCNWKSASFKSRFNLVENSPWWRSPPLQAPPPPSPAKRQILKLFTIFLSPIPNTQQQPIFTNHSWTAMAE